HAIAGSDTLSRPRPSPAANVAEPTTAEPRTPGLSSLLNDVADRARAATASPAAMSSVAARVRSDGHMADLPAARVAATLDVSRPEPERATGFRGLAMRTLTPARVSARAPTQRLEPESRGSNDLMLDTIDARVADSLARLLEREARRHGIELTE